MAPQRFLPYGRHTIEPADVAAVIAVLENGQLTGGMEIAAFEQALAIAVDAPEAVACSNGTTALHLAVAALDITLGARVVVPTLSFLASANAPRYCGAEVVFADVDARTGLMGPEHFLTAIDKAGDAGVAAVIPVHLNGQACDMSAIHEIAAARGIKVIEDACHALGTVRNVALGREPVGDTRRSDAACFSFHAVKTIAMGEGGAITTRNSALADRMRRLRSHGMSRQPVVPRSPDLGLSPSGAPNPWYYEMEELGWNYRLTDLQAALGRSQLSRISGALAKRQALVRHYDGALASLAPTVQPLARCADQDVGWHLYVVLIDFVALGRSRADVMNALSARGVGTQVHYLPIHLQPYYAARYGKQSLPGAEAYYSKCLTLPLYPDMTFDDADNVVAALRRALSSP